MEFKSERHARLDMRHPSKPKHIAPPPRRVRPHFLGKISLCALAFPAVIVAIILGLQLWFMLGG